MSQNTHVYDKFQGYTTEDCACEFCLHRKRKTTLDPSGCKLSACCCAEERRQARIWEKTGVPPCLQ
jgi:hypothetical protein